MKKTVTALVAVLIITGVSAQTPRYLDPEVVAVGKELPRGNVVSHDSKADAVRGTYGASKYLQPLEGWTRSETAEAVTFKTRFKIPFGWIEREQFLYVGRTTGSFGVVINGSPAAYSQTGSTPSEFDITSAAKEGANDLEIVIYKDPVARKLENSRSPRQPAIEGEAYILSQPRIRVRDVAVSTRMEGSDGLLELGVILKSHRLNPHDYTVYWELLNPAGEIMAEGRRDSRLDMRREDTVRFFANIPRVVPWSHEEPRLYTLFIKTQNEGRFREYLAFRVGFRSIDLGDDGALRINGTPLPVSMREFSPTGDAAAMRGEISRMRSDGVVGLMLRGAPPSREFFALCDSMGVYVACRADIDTHLSGDSRKVGGNPSNDPAWKGAYLDRTLAMYHTSKNHPSVAMFSLASASANGYNLYETYLTLKSLEAQRPVVYTDAEGEWNTDLPTRRSAADRRGEVEGDNTAPAQWITLEPVNVAEGRFKVSNLRYYTPLSGEVLYRVMVGRKVVSNGMVPVDVAPRGESEITVPIAGIKEGKAFSVALDLAVERAYGDYLPRSRSGSSPSSAVSVVSAVLSNGLGKSSTASSDADLRVYRRLDLPLAPEARTVILSREFEN